MLPVHCQDCTFCVGCCIMNIGWATTHCGIFFHAAFEYKLSTQHQQQDPIKGLYCCRIKAKKSPKKTEKPLAASGIKKEPNYLKKSTTRNRINYFDLQLRFIYARLLVVWRKFSDLDLDTKDNCSNLTPLESSSKYFTLRLSLTRAGLCTLYKKTKQFH